MPTDWDSTWLEKIDQLGGQTDFGSGAFGATDWANSIQVADDSVYIVTPSGAFVITPAGLDVVR